MSTNRTEYRVSSGSCPVCLDRLNLAAVQGEDGGWYCSDACAHGKPRESRVYVRDLEALSYSPDRFLKRRMPKELKSTTPRR